MRLSCAVRQGHLHHEGEGAPRVARPVQALGDPVRRARRRRRPCAFAAVRVRGAAARGAAAPGAAAPGAAPHHAALDAAAAVFPVVGRGRGRAPRAWLARAADRRSRWAGAARRGRTVGAQGRVLHRARGAAGSGRLAQPEETVSARAAALTRPADAPTRGRAESGARARRARLTFYGFGPVVPTSPHFREAGAATAKYAYICT